MEFDVDKSKANHLLLVSLLVLPIVVPFKFCAPNSLRFSVNP